MSSTLNLTMQLISLASVTPDDAGCQQVIADRLKKFNFKTEHLRFGEVDNLWARYGTQSPLIVFAGHTDVVPTGPVEDWTTDPFQPMVRDGYLYGRGAADMKSGLAAMIVAAENFIQKNPIFTGSIAFLITSDEEGPSIDGTKKVIEKLVDRKEKIDYCIVGEASSEKKVGDQIRVGRRGSLHGKLTIHGKQGHVAFPHLAKNPIHDSAAALSELAHEIWDKGNEYFPATTFQISNIHAGTGAANVIPGSLNVLFNFRFSTAVTIDELQTRVKTILEKHKLSFEIEWDASAQPFLTQQGKLVHAVQKTIKDVLNIETVLSTGGGTSDGRFIAATGAEVIELGPVNATVHQANECVSVKDLDVLTEVYEKILENLFL
ncbi:MAG: succinyl-diaminopimelate desuccinylase [Gammaproteobacteria bacterium]|nr:succinyl-diaminopimelate desuccinylase [Gammaproteobacteria bacterium]